jgi:hypothetical protein
MSTMPQGANNVWTVQSAVTVGSSAAQTDVTNANMLTIHLGAEIYINFGSSSTAASSSANDIILGAGLHSLVVPKSGTNAQYLNYSRVGGADVTMRLVFN